MTKHQETRDRLAESYRSLCAMYFQRNNDPDQAEYLASIEVRGYERGFDAAMAIKDERVQKVEEVLKLIDIGQRDKISAPYDAVIKELCERIGYGAVMDSAARQWRKIDPNGALTRGPCVVTVKNALAEYQAEMEGK